MIVEENIAAGQPVYRRMHMKLTEALPDTLTGEFIAQYETFHIGTARRDLVAGESIEFDEQGQSAAIEPPIADVTI
jgi:hypothetical protein